MKKMVKSATGSRLRMREPKSGMAEKTVIFGYERKFMNAQHSKSIVDPGNSVSYIQLRPCL